LLFVPTTERGKRVTGVMDDRRAEQRVDRVVVTTDAGKRFYLAERDCPRSRKWSARKAYGESRFIYRSEAFGLNSPEHKRFQAIVEYLRSMPRPEPASCLG